MALRAGPGICLGEPGAGSHTSSGFRQPVQDPSTGHSVGVGAAMGSEVVLCPDRSQAAGWAAPIHVGPRAEAQVAQSPGLTLLAPPHFANGETEP